MVSRAMYKIKKREEFMTNPDKTSRGQRHPLAFGEVSEDSNKHESTYDVNLRKHKRNVFG